MIMYTEYKLKAPSMAIYPCCSVNTEEKTKQGCYCKASLLERSTTSCFTLFNVAKYTYFSTEQVLQ